MSIKDQLSKIRVFQTELSMIVTRLRESQKAQNAPRFYVSEALKDFWRAQDKLSKEAEKLQDE